MTEAEEQERAEILRKAWEGIPIGFECDIEQMRAIVEQYDKANRGLMTSEEIRESQSIIKQIDDDLKSLLK